ncbi:hypothetical protein [Dongia rigui]|uniref:Right handed beta helix domain-containing protein n=1 Tax=Dongia rigui TaxID=940149 RepID=A0ABU5DZ98_9PROT|nr:hypothetical protein [Dongia rigui]MDY0872563.1 hypothetical protein [Dongia rigui]
MPRQNDQLPTSPFPRLNRRQFAQMMLAAGLVALGKRQAWAAIADGFSAETQKAIAAARSVKYFTRWGNGGHSGENWSNAMPLQWLSKSQALAGPGDALLLAVDPAKPALFELGRKKPQVFLRNAGTADAPIIVMAGVVNDAGALALPAGDDAGAQFRSVAPWSVAEFNRGKGAPFFIGIEKGAAHALLAGFRMEGTSGDGFFKFRSGKTKSADFNGFTFADIAGTNVGRVIETDEGSRLRNITVRDCRAFGIIRGFARFHDLSQAVFRNLDLDANNLDAGAKNVCQLIAITKGSDILFENVKLSNAISTKTLADGSPGYTQGDGIVTESGTSRVTIRNCHGSNMGDAAFDLKTRNVTIEKSGSDNCKFGARIWAMGDNLIRDCDFREPVSRGNSAGCCVQVTGQCEIVDTKLQAGDGTFAFGLNKLKSMEPPVIRMHGGAIDLRQGATLAHSNATGVIELHDVAVNGEMRSETITVDSSTAP